MSKMKVTIAHNVQDILHGQEVESWEDLSSALQMMQEVSSTGFKAVLHVFHNRQNI